MKNSEFKQDFSSISSFLDDGIEIDFLLFLLYLKAAIFSNLHYLDLIINKTSLQVPSSSPGHLPFDHTHLSASLSPTVAALSAASATSLVASPLHADAVAKDHLATQQLINKLQSSKAQQNFVHNSESEKIGLFGIEFRHPRSRFSESIRFLQVV